MPIVCVLLMRNACCLAAAAAAGATNAAPSRQALLLRYCRITALLLLYALLLMMHGSYCCCLTFTLAGRPVSQFFDCDNITASAGGLCEYKMALLMNNKNKSKAHTYRKARERMAYMCTNRMQ